MQLKIDTSSIYKRQVKFRLDNFANEYGRRLYEVFELCQWQCPRQVLVLAVNPGA